MISAQKDPGVVKVRVTSPKSVPVKDWEWARLRKTAFRKSDARTNSRGTDVPHRIGPEPHKGGCATQLPDGVEKSYFVCHDEAVDPNSDRLLPGSKLAARIAYMSRFAPGWGDAPNGGSQE